MTELDKSIFQFTETARDQDSAQCLVYLQDRGGVVNLETCTDLGLVSAAVEQLTRELDEIGEKIAKLECMEEEIQCEALRSFCMADEEQKLSALELAADSDLMPHGHNPFFRPVVSSGKKGGQPGE